MNTKGRRNIGRRRKKKEEEKEREKMEIGEKVCIKRSKSYGNKKRIYQEGEIIKKYENYLLVEFKCKNGESYKEGIKERDLKKREELGENEYIY